MTGFEIAAGAIIVFQGFISFLLARKLEQKGKVAVACKEKSLDLERQLDLCKKIRAGVTYRNREAFVGARVIIRSNEPEPLAFGVVVGFQEVSLANNPFPIVVLDGEDKAEKLCMAAIIPYNEKILAQVKDLSPREQWEAISKIGIRWE